MVARRLAVYVVPLLFITSAWAHSGRTDSSGGHHDRKNGGYHYHNSGASKSSAITVELIQQQNTQSTPALRAQERREEERKRRNEKRRAAQQATKSRKEKEAAGGLAQRALALLSHTETSQIIRTWIDSSGDNKIEAELVGLAVILKKSNGKQVSVPLEKLSEADREYVLQSLWPHNKSNSLTLLSGKVVGVYDGDTVTVLVGTEQVKVRLQGVDCPERGQPFGKAAGKLASSLCFGKQAEVHVSGKDRYGRTLGDVVVDGKNVSHELLAAGLAWHYKQYSDDKKLAALETEARKAERGLWADSDAIAPWEWRRLPTRERKKQEADASEPYRPSEGFGASPRGPPKKETSAGEYWLTTSSGVRHNSSCRWYHNTKSGRACGPDDGRACKICGG